MSGVRPAYVHVLSKDRWSLHRGGPPTCVQIRVAWLDDYRDRVIAEGGRVLAVYRPKASQEQ